jgi:hypothetical protein
MADDAATLALRDRIEGRARTGTVDLRSFDQGIVTTLGATLETVQWTNGEESRNYFLNVPLTKGRVGRPGLPGVPVIFAFPESVLEKFDYPLISIRRDDIAPTMSRWHPGTLQYRAPAVTAQEAVVDPNPGNPDAVDVVGWDKVEQLQQAAPYDITYTISILARNRGGMGQTNQANAILKYVLRVFQPYSYLYLNDSIGDGRTYDCFQESVSHLDDVPEVADRVIGFAVTIRIEGELDLLDPEEHNTVTSLPTFNTEVL